MIDPEKVQQGWYIARAVLPDGFSSWALVWVKGTQPFLSVWPAIMGFDSVEWHRNERYLARGISIDENTQWQFAQRIDLPTEAIA